MKSKINSIIFILFLSVFMLVNILSPAKLISSAERRKLLQFDSLKMEDLFSGGFNEDFEKVLLDQFIFRDDFRALKSFFQFNILMKNDNNNIAVVGDHVFKIEYPLNQKYLDNFNAYINDLYETYLTENKVYYSIIPDKNYFLSDSDGILKLDYDLLEDEVVSGLNSNMTYIPIFDKLSLNDYYKTDPHWKQESIFPVVYTIKGTMGADIIYTENSYEKNYYSPFYGAYYGQSALTLDPDKITYLSNISMENVTIENLERPNDSELGIYSPERLEGIDSYDVYLSGATPLIKITNNESNNDKRLIIFRDSFSSSLAPLLYDSYEETILVDTRYMSKELLKDYVDFEGADVLFIYSASLINQSNILK